MRNLGLMLILATAFACQKSPETPAEEKLDRLAYQYVKLGLSIGQYDAPFIDAYYGPDSLKPSGEPLAEFPKDSFLLATQDLSSQVQALLGEIENDTIKDRAEFLLAQLTAYDMRIRIFSGETPSFDEESQALFGVTAPTYSSEHFDSAIAKLDQALPGEGSIDERYKAIIDRFIIPAEKVDTVLKVAIAESRKRTLEHIALPENENFKMELVTDKPWGGYNWYQGNYASLIQINTDLPIYISRAIDVGSHESYPGHHVFNMLLEKNLFNEKGWIETSMYPLYSPQSLIAEGSANFGIEMIFPGEEKAIFCKEVLLPLAGMDTTGISNYFNVLELKSDLSYAGNEVGRGYLNGDLNEEEAIDWMMKYEFRTRESAEKSLRFINTYRSYIINYNYGKDLVRNFIEQSGGKPDNPDKRWELFTWLLSNQVLPSELIK